MYYLPILMSFGGDSKGVLAELDRREGEAIFCMESGGETTFVIAKGISEDFLSSDNFDYVEVWNGFKLYDSNSGYVDSDEGYFAEEVYETSSFTEAASSWC